MWLSGERLIRKRSKPTKICSCSLMVEPLPSKQMMRVRFPSIAPGFNYDGN